ncbi:hypothetical protein MTR_3g032950 [Medicago truncatula]|uniref:Tf2-1-like SH3-like domain-containing protein n=1 Tax=Medicago truncatula TaxID=3880 RepID=G7J0U3_MEDTR|nr:hypothetical protein MTR_3g032950 [Medicago truncatula]
MCHTQFHKLCPKSSMILSPYKILDRIRQVFYPIELPLAANIHNIFHVSQLKSCAQPVVTLTFLWISPQPNQRSNGKTACNCCHLRISI